MPQLPESTRKRKFYRYTFEIKDKGRLEYRHTMFVNPSDASVEEPARVTITQTLGGAYVSNFGQGLFKVNLSGTTGFNARRNSEGVLTDGYTEMQNFRRKLYRDFITRKSPKKEMFWYNWETEEYYKVIPEGFRLLQSKTEPLLFRYEIPLVCLEPLIGVTKPNTNNLATNINIQKVMGMGDILSSISEIMSHFRGSGA